MRDNQDEDFLLSTLARITPNLSFLIRRSHPEGRDLSGQGDYAFGYQDLFKLFMPNPLVKSVYRTQN